MAKFGTVLILLQNLLLFVLDAGHRLLFALIKFAVSKVLNMQGLWMYPGLWLPIQGTSTCITVISVGSPFPLCAACGL